MTNAANSVPEITLALNTTNNGQSAAHITTLANGNFLAVWQVDAASSDPYGEASEFVGRIFTPGGVQVGPDRQIGAGTHALEDAYTGAGQYDVVGLANGGYAFVYTKHMTTASGLSTSGAGPVTGVFAQRYDSAGNAVGGEITVLPALDITYPTPPNGSVTYASVENHPHAYATTDGGFAVAAREQFPLDASGFYSESAGLAEVNSGGGVVFSKFDAAGARNGFNFAANQDFQSYAVAINSNHVGALGIRQLSQGDEDLFLRQEQNGSFLGLQDITAYTDGLGPQSSEYEPAIAALPNGNFIVSYTNQSAVSPTGPTSVEAQIIGPTGAVVKPHFLVPAQTPVDERSSAVGVFPNGNFVIVWKTDRSNGHGAYLVHGQVFDENGNRINGEFEVNDNGFGSRPFVTVIDNNTFAVAEDKYGGGAALHILQVNPTPVTVQRALSLYASYPFMSGVNVIDSTANVAGNLDGLQTMQSHGGLASIALTDSGTMSLTANQLTADAATLGLVTSPYSLNVDAQGGSLNNYFLSGNVSNFTLSNESSAYVGGNSRFDTINVGHGNDTVYAGSGGSYLIGNGGNDVLVGGAGTNTIYALGGNNYLQGGAGSLSDVLVATGAGNDTFYGGSGDNYIVGGTGRNTIVAGPNGLESLYGSGTADYMVGGGTSCVLSEQGSGNDTLFGGLNGNNYIVGSNGDCLLVGGGLSDYIFAGNGNTTMYGGNGTDYIYTGSGTDFIWTDNVGSPQSTDYIYETGASGTNTIADFTPGDVASHDVLVLSGTNLHSFADVQAHATQGPNSPYTVISASATDQIYLYNVQPFQLTANDFLFT